MSTEASMDPNTENVSSSQEVGSENLAAVSDGGENPPVSESVPAPENAGPPKHWYIVHTYSGFEKKVKESLEGRVAAYGLTDKIGQIVIPTESVVEVRGGKKVITSRMCYPGYVLVEMDMDDYTWHVVRQTPRVTGFVGSGQTPSPLTDEEVQNILNRATTTAEKPKPKLTFERGEKIRINEGPFINFTGEVEDVNSDRSTLKVTVTIFGRSTPVELDFAQVEKVS
jgi:transcriptional antiterminator NusG